MALTRLPSYTLLNTDSYTFGNANVSGNVSAGNIKTDHILYANGTPYAFTSNAGGSNTQVQFNDSNSFAGSANLTFNKTSNTLTVTNITANGAGLTSLTGANVTGFVPNANVANTAFAVAGANVSGEVSFAATANSVAVANVSGIGNIATINKDGNSSNILYGNGVFASAPVTYGNSNVQVYLPNYSGNLNPGNITVTTDLVVGGNLTISGTTTTINSTAVSINDINIVLANNASNALQANGAGITINGASANILYNSTSNAFTFSHPISADGGLLTNIAVANITGIGNVATLNKDGNASNILYGNGVFASAPVTYGNSNVATFLASFGSNSISTTGNISASNVTVSSNITTSNANVTGTLTANVISTSGSGSGNISGANWIIANYFQGNASSLSSITGANVSGFVPNANVANTAYSVAAANVTGLGNIATINKDGNASNLLYGNGVFAAAPVSYGNSNVATFLASFGSNTITTTGNISVGNIIATNIGNIAALNKDGNSSNVLYGNGVFAAPAGSSPGVVIDTFTGNGVQTAFTLTSTPANANMVTVNYNGAILTKDTYTISGSVLTFVAAPADGYSLEITTLTGSGSGTSGASRVQSTILGMVFGG